LENGLFPLFGIMKEITRKGLKEQKINSPNPFQNLFSPIKKATKSKG
jgi:hypothetical protein